LLPPFPAGSQGRLASNKIHEAFTGHFSGLGLLAAALKGDDKRIKSEYAAAFFIKSLHIALLHHQEKHI
jgi:hypothetical protein